MHCSLASLGCVFGFAPANEHKALTGLRALKIAQRRLRPEVRSKLLSIASSRTDATLVPEAWRFVFLDEATSGHCRVVTVAAKASSEHPDTIEAFNSTKPHNLETHHPIAQNKIILDSHKILDLAREKSKLKGILAAEYRLLQPRNGREPIWYLNFYGESELPIARFQAGAKTGVVELIENSEKKVLCEA